MRPEIAEELISAGTRRARARAVSVGELDEIAAEMSGPPWP